MEVDWTLLESNQRLQRENCARAAGKLLAAAGSEVSQSVKDRASSLLCHDQWEGRHGGLLLLQECLKWYQQGKLDPSSHAQWADVCIKLLSDKEVRVRKTSGAVIALLCKLVGLKLYDEKVAQPLLASIESNMNLERDGQAFLDDDEETKKLTEKLLAGEGARQMKQASSRASRASSMQSTIFHDTAGWGTLETDMSCLQQVIASLGAEFAPRLDSQGEVAELLCTAALHMNRFVREEAFRSLEAVIQSLHDADNERSSPDAAETQSEFLLDDFAQSSDVVARLGSGLCDEWGNVRMQASVALRCFLVSLQTSLRRQPFYHELMPKFCLNRYNMADGVSSYTRETWQLIIGARGRETVLEWLPHLVPFYIMQTRVSNSEARVAAAKCIGELAARIDKASVSTYAPDLFEALIPRLSRHDAWEVKEAACSALLELVRTFPDRFNLSANFPELVPSLSAILADKTWSVREGSALVLGELVKVSEEDAAGSVWELCLDGLTSASKEVDEREKYGKEDLAEVKRERDNDFSLHSNQDALDCCAVGDLDEDDSEQLGKLSLSKIYNRAQQQKLDMGFNSWERTDGCLYLVRELGLSNRWSGAAERWEKALMLVASSSEVRHFVKHLALLRTLWKVLPEIAKVIGAEIFNKHLGGFAGSLAYSLSCEDRLTVQAAEHCLLELNRCIGNDRLSECFRQHDPAFLDQISAHLPEPTGKNAVS
eukprot:TRINITY_DN29938_c0_g1_i1.p1 TRINITY_DN29938_c0_g1~~TRINITY_DN29938_c0_g1_i1.p1  ORF type:complete len:737 (-),score=142.96 TRINITY_DN29938_c0_g1_i1:58-2199(-)